MWKRAKCENVEIKGGNDNLKKKMSHPTRTRSFSLFTLNSHILHSSTFTTLMPGSRDITVNLCWATGRAIAILSSEWRKVRTA